MRIRVAFQGGYGGLFAAKPLTHDIDTDELADEVRTELLRLIEDARLLEAGGPPPAPDANRARDAVTYRVSIQDRGVSRTFAFDDASASPEVRPLLQFLQQLALEKRTSGG